MAEAQAGLGALLRSDDDAPDRPEGRRAAKDAIRRYFRAIAARDMAALADSMTPDVVYELPFSETGSTEPGGFRRYEGAAAVLAFWDATTSSGLATAAPDDVELSITGDGSRVFIEQRGNVTMADGRPYRNRYVFRFDIRDNRVAHVKEYFNPVVSAVAFRRPVANGIMIDSL